jgi:FixJ family two-component response regulator
VRPRRATAHASLNPHRPSFRTSLATLTEDLVDAVLAALRGSSSAEIAERADRPQEVSPMRSTPRAALPDLLAMLSPRERDVFDHALRGSSNDSMARALGITVRTGQTHRAGGESKARHPLSRGTRAVRRHARAARGSAW